MSEDAFKIFIQGDPTVFENAEIENLRLAEAHCEAIPNRFKTPEFSATEKRIIAELKRREGLMSDEEVDRRHRESLDVIRAQTVAIRDQTETYRSQARRASFLASIAAVIAVFGVLAQWAGIFQAAGNPAPPITNLREPSQPPQPAQPAQPAQPEPSKDPLLEPLIIQDKPIPSEGE